MSVTRSSPPRGADPAPGPEAADPADDERAARADCERGGPAPLELKLLVAAAVVAGLVLRFVARSPLWLDEALSVNIAKLPLADIPEALRHDGHPPLYYVALHVWMQVVGTGDAAVRALSGVLAVVTLPVAYLVGRRRGGPVLGAILLGLFALSPFVLRYATETRMYALVMLVVLLGYLVLDDMLRRGRDGWGRVVALAGLTAALLYTHYWTMWLLASVGIVAVVTWRRAGPADVRRAGGRVLIGLGLGAVAFLPWVPTLAYQSRHTGTPWAGPVRPVSLLASTFTDFGGGAFKDAQFVGGVLLVLVLLGVFGRALDGRRIEVDLRTVPTFRVEAIVVGLTILLGLTVSYATRSAFVTRYAAVFLPLVLLVVAGGLLCFTARWIRSGAVAVVLGLFSFGCVYNLVTDRTQAGVIAAEVARTATAGDVVLYCPDQLGPAGMRLMPDGLRQIAFPSLTAPERVDWVDYRDRNAVDPAAYAQQVLDYATPGHGVYVVWSGGYKTHQGTCDALVASLASARPGAQTLVSEDGDTYFEHANLTYFPGA